MRCTCPNCDRGLGLRWLPALSKTWQCRCGVSNQHSANSFLEAWLRPVFLWSLLLNFAVLLCLEFAGDWELVHGSVARLLVATLGMSFVFAVGLVLLSCPIGWMLAHLVGVPFSTYDTFKAALLSIAVLGLTAAALWMLVHFQSTHAVLTLR